jgi:hypothetical protein
MARGELARIALTLVATFGLAISAHVAAPTVRGECDGGVPYSEAVRLAHGAIVGVMSQVGRDEIGFPYVAEVAVERAVGTKVGPVWRGQAYAGMACDGDEPMVGARVVVLLDVTILAVPPSDTFYTIGFAVTAAQVARLASDLPDTAAAGAAEAGTHPWSPVTLEVVAAFVAVSALLLWSPGHRRSRSR